MDYRKRALEELAYHIASDNMGIYPKSVIGGEKPYEKRTERMEGWNECVEKYTNYTCRIGDFLEEASVEVQDLILSGDISLHLGESNVSMFVNCNDLFCWGCADCEEILLEELPSLQEAIKDAESVDSKEHGGLLWVARKRQIRPQGAYYAHVSPGLGKLFDACGEFRPAGIGNPVASSFEDGEAYRKER